MPENEKNQDKNFSKIASITPTPTNFISNPCKFRGQTIEILGVLSNSGGMTTREISDRTGISIKVLSVILPRGEKKGIFERKEQWGWLASPFGFLILSINNNNYNTNTTHIQPILIIEGEDPFFPGKTVNLSFIQSFLKTIAVSLGVPTLYTSCSYNSPLIGKNKYIYVFMLA